MEKKVFPDCKQLKSYQMLNLLNMENLIRKIQISKSYKPLKLLYFKSGKFSP